MDKDTTTNYENIINKVNMESLQEILIGYEGKIDEALMVCGEAEGYRPNIIRFSPENEMLDQLVGP